MNQLAAYTVWTDAVRRGLATADEMTRWLRLKALQSALNELDFWKEYRYVMEAK